MCACNALDIAACGRRLKGIRAEEVLKEATRLQLSTAPTFSWEERCVCMNATQLNVNAEPAARKLPVQTDLL
eukprot:1266857-Pleurochrysis_carterae.AAC.1